MKMEIYRSYRTGFMFFKKKQLLYISPGIHITSRLVVNRGPCLSVFVSQSVEGEHHEKAVELLKAAQGTVKLVVRYTPKVLEEMESRFEKMRSAKRRQQNNYPKQKCPMSILIPSSCQRWSLFSNPPPPPHNTTAVRVSCCFHIDILDIMPAQVAGCFIITVITKLDTMTG